MVVVRDSFILSLIIFIDGVVMVLFLLEININLLFFCVIGLGVVLDCRLGFLILFLFV